MDSDITKTFENGLKNHVFACKRTIKSQKKKKNLVENNVKSFQKKLYSTLKIQLLFQVNEDIFSINGLQKIIEHGLIQQICPLVFGTKNFKLTLTITKLRKKCKPFQTRYAFRCVYQYISLQTSICSRNLLGTVNSVTEINA